MCVREAGSSLFNEGELEGWCSVFIRPAGRVAGICVCVCMCVSVTCVMSGKPPIHYARLLLMNTRLFTSSQAKPCMCVYVRVGAHIVSPPGGDRCHGQHETLWSDMVKEQEREKERWCEVM